MFPMAMRRKMPFSWMSWTASPRIILNSSSGIWLTFSLPAPVMSWHFGKCPGGSVTDGMMRDCSLQCGVNQVLYLQNLNRHKQRRWVAQKVNSTLTAFSYQRSFARLSMKVPLDLLHPAFLLDTKRTAAFTVTAVEAGVRLDG